MLSPFRIGLLAFFGFLLIVGALMFAGIIPSPGGKPNQTRTDISILGTIPSSQFYQLLKKINDDYNTLYTLKYSEVSEKNLRNALLEAVAAGSPPDLVFFPHERLISISDMLVPIPASAFSTREFKNTFVEAGEIFIGRQGVYALPLAIDPLVLYWNRDILRSKGKTNPPSLWQDVYDMSASVTERDSTGNIGKGLLTIAMGETKNINWFKDILSLIFLEAGDKIVEADSNGNLAPSLGFAGKSGSRVASNASQTISFYVNFALPTTRYYTWTAAMPPSIDAFIAEKLALYIGRASDYQTILAKNPHLNFDSAIVPQFNNNPVTYGSVFGMGIMRKSKKQAISYEILNILKEKEYNEALAKGMFITPARKDLLSKTQNDPFYETFYRSAEISSNWPDPEPEKIEEIFEFLINDVASGRVLPEAAVQAAVSNLRSFLEKINEKNRNAKEI